MGDPVELTIWPKHQNIFYYVSSSGLSFDVKAPANAIIGLARRPGSSCDYWVGIGDGNRCWIKKDEEHCKSMPVQDILSADQFRKFWLQWNGGLIRLGRHSDNKPIVTYVNKLPDIKYITFDVMREHNPVHWKFDLAPMRPRLPYKHISAGKLTWIEAGDQLPDGALIGGYENETLYIVRAPHRLSLTPGKFVPSEGVAYVSWGGEANPKSEFEVLCGYDCTWVTTCEDRIPVGAVSGGYSEDRQERLYIGRAVHNGHIIPGKVQPSHKVCYIAFDGHEIAKKRYEILVEPSNIRCVNKTYLSGMDIDSASESDQDDDHTWQADDEEDIYDYDSNDDLNEVMAL
ncbi:uncharacterized protein LOC126372285 [Pectinophora gossypiella]|uniref:uncharacterized protein LOC126372285 n=1 Tax=Pectinophora gossypiella TaxID=13191 RepID=UPI00214E3FB7|nr:uncharacterized protein LOC126372285 [Pectinophora gossypiella]